MQGRAFWPLFFPAWRYQTGRCIRENESPGATPGQSIRVEGTGEGYLYEASTNDVEDDKREFEGQLEMAQSGVILAPYYLIGNMLLVPVTYAYCAYPMVLYRSPATCNVLLLRLLAMLSRSK